MQRLTTLHFITLLTIATFCTTAAGNPETKSTDTKAPESPTAASLPTTKSNDTMQITSAPTEKSATKTVNDQALEKIIALILSPSAPSMDQIITGIKIALREYSLEHEQYPFDELAINSLLESNNIASTNRPRIRQFISQVVKVAINDLSAERCQLPGLNVSTQSFFIINAANE